MTLAEFAKRWLIGPDTFSPNQASRIANEQGLDALSALFARRLRESALA
jgi:hypothetical protein